MFELSPLGWMASVAALGLLILALAYCVMICGYRCCATVVHESTTVVVKSMGQYNRTLSPGVYFLLPCMEEACETSWSCYVEDPSSAGRLVPKQRVSVYLPTQTCYMDPPPVPCYSKDNSQVKFNVKFGWKIVDARKCVFLGGNLYARLQDCCASALVDVAKHYAADEAEGQRPAIEASVKRLMHAETTEFGVEVQSVRLQWIGVSAELKAARERVAQATKQAEAKAIEASQAHASSLAHIKRVAELHKATMVQVLEEIKTTGSLAYTLQRVHYDALELLSGKHTFVIHASHPSVPPVLVHDHTGMLCVTEPVAASAAPVSGTGGGARLEMKEQ